MDFDPDNPKWLCCCCQLPNGLMILASSEIALSLTLLLYSITYIIMSDPEQLWFMIILMLISIMYGIASSFLLFGIRNLKENWMYPTLAARAVVIIFLQVFGVSITIQPSHAVAHVNWNESEDQKIRRNLVERKTENEPTIAQRLMLLIFFMLIISIFVFYTLYLIVRCIHYVKAYRRLIRRKHSLIVACQIDLTDNRHNSVFQKKFAHSA